MSLSGLKVPGTARVRRRRQVGHKFLPGCLSLHGGGEDGTREEEEEGRGEGVRTVGRLHPSHKRTTAETPKDFKEFYC